MNCIKLRLRYDLSIDKFSFLVPGDHLNVNTQKEHLLLPILNKKLVNLCKPKKKVVLLIASLFDPVVLIHKKNSSKKLLKKKNLVRKYMY